MKIKSSEQKFSLTPKTIQKSSHVHKEKQNGVRKNSRGIGSSENYAND